MSNGLIQIEIINNLADLFLWCVAASVPFGVHRCNFGLVQKTFGRVGGSFTSGNGAYGVAITVYGYFYDYFAYFVASVFWDWF
jgi:hypothetical protein